MPVDIQKSLEKNAKLLQEKSLWNNHWQLAHEYVLQRKADFTSHREPGAFINSDIWSSVAPKAAETCASALIGLVWPDNYSFSLEPFGKDMEEDDEIKEFWQYATEQLQADLDDPSAGLTLALDEFMLDYVVSGTPAIHAEEGENSLYRFDAWNVQEFAIDEGADGYVDTFYRHKDYTYRQAELKFGLKNLSPKIQEALKNKRFNEKLKVLHVIEPRDVDPSKGSGSLNMPWASYYIEIDSKHLIRESGYNELPTFASRYSKRIGEKYGRSPAMRALPDIQELNAIWELVTIGLEKNFDPPLAVYDDGSFGGGVIDTSAGAINVMNIKESLKGSAPIQPIFTVGQFSDIAVLIERLENTIGDHFMIDVLLDLNNEKEMTAREYMGRQAIRQRVVRSVVSRLLSELFDRLIQRCFNMGLRKGRYGYVEGSAEAQAWQAMNPDKDIRLIPQKIVDMQGKNQRVYWIRYNTPAAREQQAEQAQGVMNMYEAIGSVAEFDKTVLDLPNNERALKNLGDIWSVPQDFWNTKDELKQLREAGARANEEAAQLNKAQQTAAIAKDAGMAQNAMRSATRPAP